MPTKLRKPRTPKRRRSRPPADPDEADSESDPPTPPKRPMARATGPSPGTGGPAPEGVVRLEAPILLRHASSPARWVTGVEVHEDHGVEVGGEGGREEGRWGERRNSELLAGVGLASPIPRPEEKSGFDSGRVEASGLALGLDDFGFDDTVAPSLSSAPLMSPPMERSAFSPYSAYTKSVWNYPSQRPSPSPTPAPSSLTHPARPLLTTDSRRHSSAFTFASSFAALAVTPSPTPPLPFASSPFTFPTISAPSTEAAETPATRGLAASLSAHESRLLGGHGGRRGSLPGPASPAHSKASSVSSTLSDTLSHFGSSLGLGLHHPRASPDSKAVDGGSREGSPEGGRRRGRSGSVFSVVSSVGRSTLDYAMAAMQQQQQQSPPRAGKGRAVGELKELPPYHELVGMQGWADLTKITVQLRAVDPSPDNVATTAFLNWLMNGKDQHWGAQRAKLAEVVDSGNVTPVAGMPKSMSATARVASPARKPLTPRQSIQDLAAPAGSPSRVRAKGGPGGAGGGVGGGGVVGPKVEFAAGTPMVLVESTTWCARFAPEGRGVVEILKCVLRGPG